MGSRSGGASRLPRVAYNESRAMISEFRNENNRIAALERRANQRVQRQGRPIDREAQRDRNEARAELRAYQEDNFRGTDVTIPTNQGPRTLPMNVTGTRSGRIGFRTEVGPGPDRFPITHVSTGLLMARAPNRRSALIASQAFATRVNWGDLYTSRGTRRTGPAADRAQQQLMTVTGALYGAGLLMRG